VLALLDRPPKVRDTVEYEGLRFEVTAVHGRGVKECVVQRVE
jgi:CBS domain containing-hemolysin-like protein